MAEHDPSYKLLFSHRDLVADLIRGFVHEDWVAQLDFTTLQRVGEIGVSHDLRERKDDMIWRLRWGERWVYGPIACWSAGRCKTCSRIRAENGFRAGTHEQSPRWRPANG
jgi:hypothetical protein